MEKSTITEVFRLHAITVHVGTLCSPRLTCGEAGVGIMLRFALAGLVLASAAAAPAAAVTVLNFDFGNGSGNSASAKRSMLGVSLTATGRRFTVAPNTLTNLSQTTTTNVQINATTPGIGINGGSSNPQLDTNNPGLHEAILFTSSVPNFSLRGIKLSFVDADDTLQVYGVNADDSLTSLGFAGVIQSSLVGTTVVNTAANDGTSVITLTNPTSYFARYLLTTLVGGDVSLMGTGGQDYRIDGITGSVPEPGTWAMLIVGFGFVGVAARRRKSIIAA